MEPIGFCDKFLNLSQIRTLLGPIMHSLRWVALREMLTGGAAAEFGSGSAHSSAEKKVEQQVTLAVDTSEPRRLVGAATST
jgi:hypothetical protein